MIIKEFDADQDQFLSFKEFTMFLLPSTDESLKNVSLNRAKSKYYEKNKELDQKCKEKMCKHFEKELRFLKMRD